MKEYTLKDLLLMKVQVLYDIEEQIIDSLPKVIDAAMNPNLKAAFLEHLEETKNHKTRLERVFQMLNGEPEKMKADGIRGLIKDAEWVIKHIRPESALDANLIAAAQYIEHHEMAGYGTALTWAEELELPEVAQLLEATLEEEKAADITLSELATSEVNAMALGLVLVNE